jgi:hypothetical protein
MGFTVQEVHPVTRLEQDIQLFVMLLKYPTVHSHSPAIDAVISYLEQEVQNVGLEQVAQKVGHETDDPETIIYPVGTTAMH